jgi:hypothetical protein
MLILALVTCGCWIWDGSDLVSPVGFNETTGSGQLATQDRVVAGFYGVDLSLGSLYITQGPREELRIIAEDNLIPYLRTEVIGGSLMISVEPHVNLRPTRAIEFHLTAPTIEGIGISGSGNVTWPGATVDRLALGISGSGSIELFDLVADWLDATISGSGHVRVSGQAIDQRISISGSGSYGADDLSSATAAVQISGSGSATVWVGESLIADISGSGSVFYYGNPVVAGTVSGSGRIIALGS